MSAINDPSAFYAEAQHQLACAKCGATKGPWDAHHVVARQVCRREGAPQHSPDDALRLCSGAADTCHERHTHAQERVPLACLRDENIAFAVLCFGGWGPAWVYLTSQYAGSDPRVDALLAIKP